MDAKIIDDSICEKDNVIDNKTIKNLDILDSIINIDINNIDLSNVNMDECLELLESLTKNKNVSNKEELLSMLNNSNNLESENINNHLEPKNTNSNSDINYSKENITELIKNIKDEEKKKNRNKFFIYKKK